MTERLFLQRFTALCTDALFQVRKVCASNFGDFCSVVGSKPTEEILVSGGVGRGGKWGVRESVERGGIGRKMGVKDGSRGTMLEGRREGRLKREPGE